MPITIETPEDMSDSKKLLLLSMSLNQLQTQTAKHQELLVTGNGDLPLPERVRNIETYIDGQKYWAKFLLGAIIIQTVTFASAVIWYAIRLLPVLDRLSAMP